MKKLTMNQITKKVDIMKGLKRTLIVPVVATMMHSAPVMAVEGVQSCRVIKWQPNEVYAIKSALHQRTHIILPEPIQGNPVPGNPQLWDVDGENVHLFIKPKNYGNNEGGKTTVTAISVTNNSYDFVVSRVKRNPDICVKIEMDNTFRKGANGATAKQGWATAVERENKLLQTQLMMARNQATTERAKLKDMVNQAINKYKSNVYTGYQWSGSGGFLGTDQVSDVWDDGRFTYIRLRNSNKGLMQIIGKIDGKDEVVDYDYDSNTRLYTVAGLFSQFVMKYEDSKLTVTREDNKS